MKKSKLTKVQRFILVIEEINRLMSLYKNDNLPQETIDKRAIRNVFGYYTPSLQEEFSEFTIKGDSDHDKMIAQTDQTDQIIAAVSKNRRDSSRDNIPFASHLNDGCELMAQVG